MNLFDRLVAEALQGMTELAPLRVVVTEECRRTTAELSGAPGGKTFAM